MKTAVLRRFKPTPELEAHGTFGELVCTCGDFRIYTLELPYRDRDNDGKRDPKKSCVAAPADILFKWRTDSPKHGACYEEWDDPNTPKREDARDIDHMQIHPANLAGDSDVGFVAQLEGCIAPGLSVVKFRGGHRPAGSRDQYGISASRSATKQLEEHFDRQTFRLKIVESELGGPLND